ncbi:DNA-binding GntR family transcriptional regulator [Caldalkalibacillus uzonensis]|uniref:DNA-binding GntR family transcriptional regulator n=1 Tax=Caldalkalibacillus uzonensis TaxID=353224 RepID=A0ABU0CUH1_9BACI|nr:GntR family transcriptional regulator [Caldalkalibacillus uzonensis]MDQ0340061.1 DNA-binding GntR family transcriptional regulator [Caldalkalibacillus uzonensis]
MTTNVRREQILSELRLQIITGQLRPGTRIRELQVANSFGTSQAPVREALRVLEMEGLVNVIPHTGTFVTEISFHEMEQLFEFRKLIEISSAKALIKRPFDLAPFEDVVRRMMQLALDGNVLQFTAEDCRFHQLIIEGANKNVFLRLWLTVDAQIRRFIALVSTQYHQNLTRVAEQHLSILEAIRNRDEARLTAELYRHLDLDDSWRVFLE